MEQVINIWGRGGGGAQDIGSSTTAIYLYHNLDGPLAIVDDQKWSFQKINLVGNPEYAYNRPVLDSFYWTKNWKDNRDDILAGMTSAKMELSSGQDGNVPYSQ